MEWHSETRGYSFANIYIFLVNYFLRQSKLMALKKKVINPEVKLFPPSFVLSLMSIMVARIVSRTHLLRRTGRNFVQIVMHFSSVKIENITFVKIVKHNPGIETWKNDILLTTRYIFIIWSRICGYILNTLHFFLPSHLIFPFNIYTL